MVSLDEKIVNSIAEEIRKIFNKNLISVVQFGSSVRGDYAPKKSDLNILIIRKKRDNKEIEELNKIYLKWNKKIKLAVPLVLTEQEIKTSTDVFPMEYFDIKDYNKILFGKDIFKKLMIKQKNLRLELENQIKGKVILLRGAYIRINKNKNFLYSTLISVLPSVIVILRNILRLNKKRIANEFEELRVTTEKLVKFKLNNLKIINSLKTSNEKFNLTYLRKIYSGFISEMEKLADYADKFKVKK